MKDIIAFSAWLAKPADLAASLRFPFYLTNLALAREEREDLRLHTTSCLVVRGSKITLPKIG